MAIYFEKKGNKLYFQMTFSGGATTYAPIGEVDLEKWESVQFLLEQSQRFGLLEKLQSLGGLKNLKDGYYNL